MYRSLLVPVDLAHPATWRTALPHALALARTSRGTVTVLTVVRDVQGTFEAIYFAFQVEQLLSDARQRLAGIVAELRADVPVVAEVRFGPINLEILAAVQTLGIDLVVLAAHRSPRFEVRLGHHAAFVAQHAACSVLLVRTPDMPPA